MAYFCPVHVALLPFLAISILLIVIPGPDTAMVTKNAHHHDGVCGVRRSDDGDVRRLLLRSACGVHAVNLEEAN